LYDRVSLTNNVDSRHIQQGGDTLTVFAGEILDNFLVYSLQQNLTGLEWAGGLPGTVGAGIRGNVGCFGGEIKDSLIEAEVAELKKGNITIKTLSNADLNFSYRTSTVKLDRNLIVLSGKFRLTPGDIERAKETYLGNIAYRKNRHPLEKPNCGSVFKNINKPDEVEKVLSVWPDVRESVENKWHGKVAMGYITHRLGLAAKRVGDAQLSEKHGNFILNLGNATSHDVLTIIREIQSKVSEAFGFTPEVEVEIVE
jgi:UDP-N-acetylmuramate dehydrogenase